jgi:hypothetical protein
LQDPEWVLAK